MKKFIKEKADWERLVVGVISAMLLGMGLAGIDTGKLVNASMSAVGTATTLYALWIKGTPVKDATEDE